MRHRFGRLVGTVVAFDDEVGLGTVQARDGEDGHEDGGSSGGGDGGGPSWVFHCTAIADGSRRIDVGTPVGFELAAGGPGTWEAADVRPLGSASGSDTGSGSTSG